MKSNRWIKENYVMLLAYGGLVPILFIGLYLSYQNTQLFVDHTSYNTMIFSTLGIILSLVVIVSMFYLGKFHDYAREIIKIHSTMNESLAKAQTSLLKSSFLRDEFSQKVQEKAKNNDTSKFEKALSVVQTKRDHLKETLQTLEPQLTKLIDELNKDSIRMPKSVIITILIIIGNILVGFVVYFRQGDSVTIGNFYFLIATTVGAIINFLYKWHIFEDMLSEFTDHIRRCSDVIAKLNAESNRTDFESQTYERLLNRIV